MRALRCLFLLLALPASLQAREPSDEAIQQPAPLLSQGTLNSGIETAGSTTDGQFSVLLPLHSTVGETGVLNGTLVFAEPYATWIERGAIDAGLGLGVRHLFGSQPVSALTGGSSHMAGFLEEGWYVGAHLYADMLQTSNDVRYWQMTPGLEIGTRYLELRGHYQIPLTDGETTHIAQTTIFRSSTHTQFADGRLIGNRFTTVRQKVDVLHESLEGWDLETAALVPWLDRYMDLKVVGGYARYHSTSLDAIKYDSWKTGLELRPFPACVISATYYTNEHLVGDHWMYGIRLELPFETADIGDGLGGFWGHIKAAFKPRRHHLAERLSESAHAHQVEPQTARYVSKSEEQVHSRFHGAFILPDGTVIQVRDHFSYHTEQAAGSSSGTSGTTTTSAAATTNSAGLILLGTVSTSQQSTTSSSPMGAYAVTSAGPSGLSDWISLSTSSSTNVYLPVLSGGMMWDTSRFLTTGAITIVGPPPTTP